MRYLQSIVVRRRDGLTIKMSLLDSDIQLEDVSVMGDYYYGVGSKIDSGNDNIFILKLDKDLNKVSEIIYGNSKDGDSFAIINDGTYLYIAGNAIDSNDRNRGVLLKIDSGLNIIDEQYYDMEYYGSFGNNVIAYSNGMTDAIDGAYAGGGAYSPNQDRIYLAPYYQSNQSNWHYIDCATGNIVSYTHGMSDLVQYAYIGAVYSPNQDRIYLVPSMQGKETNWHYIDCSDGSVNSYAHGIVTTIYNYAYYGGVYDATNDKIFFVPGGQAQTNRWHYVDCSDGSIHDYTQSIYATTSYSYNGGVYDEYNDRIYFVPSYQSQYLIWHYIDCTLDSIGTLTNLYQATMSIYAYGGGAYSPTMKRVYLSPYYQSSEPNWHYIDCLTDTVVEYNHGMTDVVFGAYYDAYYDSVTDRIYFIPLTQAAETNWHYVDCATGNIVSYINNSGITTAYGYYSANFSPNDSKLYLCPYRIADESTWHYMQLPSFSFEKQGITEMGSNLIIGNKYAYGNKKCCSFLEFDKSSFSLSTKKYYSETNSGDDNIFDVYYDSSNDLYGVGRIDGLNDYDCSIFKTSDLSSWTSKKITTGSSVKHEFYSVVSDGTNIYACGYTYINGNKQGLVMRFDSSLTITHQYIIDDSNDSYFSYLIYDSNYLYVVGRYSDTTEQTIIMKLNDSDLSIESQKILKSDTLDMNVNKLEIDSTNLVIVGYNEDDKGFIIQIPIDFPSGTLTSDSDDYSLIDGSFSFSAAGLSASSLLGSFSNTLTSTQTVTNSSNTPTVNETLYNFS